MREGGAGGEWIQSQDLFRAFPLIMHHHLVFFAHAPHEQARSDPHLNCAECRERVKMQHSITYYLHANAQRSKPVQTHPSGWHVQSCHASVYTYGL